MYIAFKWLLGLTLIMWCAMCGIDIFIKAMKKGNATGMYKIIVNSILLILTIFPSV